MRKQLVKQPKAQQAKQEHFHKMWHDDEWMKKNIAQGDDVFKRLKMFERLTSR